MQKNNEFFEHIISHNSDIIYALEKLNKTPSKTIFVTDENLKLIGSVTDGDFRRWAIETDDLDMAASVLTIVNKQYTSVPVDTPDEVTEKLFDHKIKIIPCIDKHGRVVNIKFKNKILNKIEINKREISKNSPSYIIAEIGNNHNGSLDLGKELVRRAVESGADSVKFQHRNLDTLYSLGEKASDNYDLGVQYTHELLSKFQLPFNQLCELFDYCKFLGVEPICTPWDNNSLFELEEYGMVAYKVASADLTNHDLLLKIAQTGKPMICSTGMSTEWEILSSIEFLKSNFASFALLHCNSTYPTPDKDVNLNYMKKIEQMSEEQLLDILVMNVG